MKVKFFLFAFLFLYCKKVKIFIDEEKDIKSFCREEEVSREKISEKIYIVCIKGEEKPHKHDENLLVILVEGKGVFIIGEKKIKMEKGDVAIVPKNVEHKFINKSKISIAIAIFY